MDERTDLRKILKWAGLVALVTLPVLVYLRNRKPSRPTTDSEDDTEIFTAELEA